MGDPRKHRKKYSTPSHPWQRERIIVEADIVQNYGLNRKYEIWKMSSILKSFTAQAKKLIASSGMQAELERKQLLNKISRLGLLKKDAKIEDVLGLTLSDIMERRLQTVVFRKEMARTIRQSRQFIVHRHICVGTKTITAPSYLVPLDFENTIQFSGKSSFSDTGHPERQPIERKQVAKKEKKEYKGDRRDKRDFRKKRAIKL